MKVSDFCNMCCGNCSFNDSLCYTSYPPRYRCTFDNNFYDGGHSCHFELAPVRHGRWIIKYFDNESRTVKEVQYDESIFDSLVLPALICSECKEYALPNYDEDPVPSRYCPHCGCKMDLED